MTEVNTVTDRRDRGFSSLEARDPAVLAELMHGQSTLVLQALSHLGV